MGANVSEAEKVHNVILAQEKGVLYIAHFHQTCSLELLLLTLRLRPYNNIANKRNVQTKFTNQTVSYCEGVGLEEKQASINITR